MTEQSSERPQRQSVRVQVYFVGEEETPILFANHIFVRYSDDGFLVSFAQSHGPYKTEPTPEELTAQGIPARIISRLLIPPNRMKEFIAILTRLYEANVKEVEEEEEEA